MFYTCLIRIYAFTYFKATENNIYNYILIAYYLKLIIINILGFCTFITRFLLNAMHFYWNFLYQIV